MTPWQLYQVIYADPPWPYTFPGTRADGKADDYQTMSRTDLLALRVPADPAGCVLYLWSIAPELPLALSVMAAWGFEYRTNAAWDKQLIGTGQWFRGQHELLLVGTRGENVHPPEPGQRVPSVIRVRRGRHSIKPAYVRELIASWYPTLRKLELFAREPHPGWDTFGNQVTASLLVQEPKPISLFPELV